MLNRLAWENEAPVAPFTAGAVGGERIVLAAADQVFLAARHASAPSLRVEKSLRLSFVPHAVALSPSGRFFLVADRARIEVWSTADGRRLLDLWTRDARRTGIVGTFARHDVGELLLWNDESSALHGLVLDTRVAAFSTAVSSFRFAAAPFVLGDHLVAVGYFADEGKQSLFGIEVAQLVSAPDSVSDQVGRKRGLHDYAYRLSAGPAGGDSFVVFRDPEDDESEPPDQDDAPTGYDDVWGVRGFYVRRADGGLVERIAWDGPIESFAPIAASPARIAAACTDGLHVIGRGAKEAAAPIDARWLAASADGREVLIQTPDGALALV